jgi:hypothetical protein
MKLSDLKRAQEERPTEHTETELTDLDKGFIWLCILVAFALIGVVTVILIAVRYAFEENLGVLAGGILLFGGIAGISILSMKR